MFLDWILILLIVVLALLGLAFAVGLCLLGLLVIESLVKYVWQ